MTGADIMGALLRDNPALIEHVRAAAIKAGRLPDNVTLPALLVRSLSIVDRQNLAREATVRSTERISVTVRASSHEQRSLIIRLVRTIGSGIIIAEMGTARRIAVLTAGAGPELDGPGNSFERSQDFTVTYDAPA